MRRAVTPQTKAWTFGLSCSLPWLLIPGWNGFEEGHGAARWWGAVLVVLLALLVAVSPLAESLAVNGQRAVWVLVAVQATAALAMLPIAPSAVPGMLIYPGIVAAALITNSRRVLLHLVALALIAMSTPLWTPDSFQSGSDQDPAWMSGVLVLALGGWMLGFAQNIRDNEELKRTRVLLADTAVVAERERIAHDLHDILGHSLTAISVQASVVRRMAERSGGDDALVEHARAIEEQARAALSDVRSTAAGIRDTSLAGELAIARQTLTSAGIDADLPTALDHVTPAGRAVFGFVVREAVTNVVRHSKASRCVVRIGERSIEVRDDGSPGEAVSVSRNGGGDREGDDGGGAVGAGGGADGLGLSGLVWRLESIGGTVAYGPASGGGFVVRAEVPGDSAPAPAGHATSGEGGSVAEPLDPDEGRRRNGRWAIS